MSMHVVIIGNPVDGIEVYGPFKTYDHAAAWTDESTPVATWKHGSCRCMGRTKYEIALHPGENGGFRNCHLQ